MQKIPIFNRQLIRNRRVCNFHKCKTITITGANMISEENKLLQGIDTVIVRVCNIDVSKAWYQGKLGLTPIWEDPKMNLVVLDTSSPTSLTLWQTDQKMTINRRTASYPIFKTRDAVLLREVLTDLNVQVGDVIQDDHLRYFSFYDPDGNLLEACEVDG